MADFDIEYKGRKNYRWSMDFLDQKKRPAEGFAVAITEIANKLPNAWSRVPADEKKDTHNMRIKSETLSLTRQWYDMTIIGDEQRAGEVVLAFRSVCSQTRHLLGWKKVLQPKFLETLQRENPAAYKFFIRSFGTACQPARVQGFFLRR